MKKTLGDIGFYTLGFIVGAVITFRAISDTEQFSIPFTDIRFERIEPPADTQPEEAPAISKSETVDRAETP